MIEERKKLLYMFSKALVSGLFQALEYAVRDEKDKLESYMAQNMVEDNEKVIVGNFFSRALYIIHRFETKLLFCTVKPAYVVTCIKGSPVLSSHLFCVP